MRKSAGRNYWRSSFDTNSSNVWRHSLNHMNGTVDRQRVHNWRDGFTGRCRYFKSCGTTHSMYSRCWPTGINDSSNRISPGCCSGQRISGCALRLRTNRLWVMHRMNKSFELFFKKPESSKPKKEENRLKLLFFPGYKKAYTSCYQYKYTNPYRPACSVGC